MPMNKPAFTTSDARTERLQENYNEGLLRESMPTADREKRDLHCLYVSPEKLMFLFQNAMEDYSSTVKNQKAKDYNEEYIRTATLPSRERGHKSRFSVL
ncbi:hypothetical protein JKF63_04815 [Porcisia hertigi]|uniref:Uncharacterized protein n=1 Tax=Porcisia hertigi TaxID=2761500 RepID=A0A836L9T8_9TRYP|nr:hypothetical protein JKF63_04815 [Porcisia hertigi]